MKKIWRKIVASNPHLEEFDAKLKTFTLPGLDGVPVADIVNFFVEEIKKNSLDIRSRAIAFSFFLSFFPALLFFFTLIPYILAIYFQPVEIEYFIVNLIKDIAPSGEVFKFLNDAITPLAKDLSTNKRPSLLTGTFLTTIFLSSNGVMTLLSSFDKSYSNYKKRTGIQARITALKITFLIFLLFTVSFVLIVGGQNLILYIFGVLELKNSFTAFLLDTLRYFMIVFLFFIGISLIYYYGPSTHQKYRFISAGSTIATVLSILASLGFSYYINNFSKYNTLYGSIGTIIILMIWLQINAFVLLIGFEINAAISHHRITANNA